MAWELHCGKIQGCQGCRESFRMVSGGLWNSSRVSVGANFFLAFIADLGNNISPEVALVLKFVDDTKIVMEIKGDEDVEVLQCLLDDLYRWQDENNMKYNGSKFQLLRIGKNCQWKDNILFTEGMEDVILPKEYVKDLGVQVDDQANYSVQLKEAVKKTKRKAAWVLRTFISRDREMMRTMWNSLVRPHLDYCS